jgi:hypothetical protein
VYRAASLSRLAAVGFMHPPAAAQPPMRLKLFRRGQQRFRRLGAVGLFRRNRPAAPSPQMAKATAARTGCSTKAVPDRFESVGFPKGKG